MTRLPRSETTKDLERLFELSLDVLAVAGMDGYFKRVNPAFQRLLGFSEEELTRSPYYEFIHPDDREPTAEQVVKLRAGEHLLHFENRYRCRNGSYRWIAWTAYPMETEGLIYAVGRDETQAKQTLDHLLNDLPGMVYRCSDLECDVMEFVSAGCLPLTGYSQEQLVGDTAIPYSSIIHEADRDSVGDAVHRAVEEDREFEIEYRIQTADGDEKWVWDRGRALRDPNGNLAKLQGYVSDVTERRRLANELSQLQRIESLGKLTGGVAHDFNNLLAVVVGNLELIEIRAGHDPAFKELIRDASDSAWRGAELSQRLLAFSRRQALAPEVVSVHALITGMESLLARTLGEVVELHVEVPETLPLVLVDAGQLENAILNLAINARDAMPQGGKLVIRATRSEAAVESADNGGTALPGRYVVIEICDSGTGMPKDVQERAFEPFFTTKETGKGTGLGLSMVYGFLNQSGGHARIESAPGHGTTVRLYLPEHEDLQPVDSQRKTSLPEDVRGRSEQVLVVEDDPAVRKMVVNNLRELGYRTMDAECAPAALRVLAEHHEQVDLLLSDIVMPGGMTGLDLARKVEKDYPSIKIVLTSGFSRQAPDDDHAFPLIAKPYRKDDLAQVLRRALDG